MSRTKGRFPLRRAAALCAALLAATTASAETSAPAAGYAVEWIENGEAVPATREDIEQRLSQPWLDGFEVRAATAGKDEPPVTLASCRDYLGVADRQVEPHRATSTDRAIFQARALDCQALVLVRDAQPAAVSHLRGLVFDDTLPDHLPWQVALIISGAEAARIGAERPRATWREALFEPLTEFSSCGPHCGRYGDPAAVQSVWLVARGDFDGDGIEDMLLSSYDAVTGGSYRASRLLLLTRRTPDGRVELIRELEH